MPMFSNTTPEGKVTKLTPAQLLRRYDQLQEQYQVEQFQAQRVKQYLGMMEEELSGLREALLDHEELMSDFPGEPESPSEKWVLKMALDIVDILDKVLDPITVTRENDVEPEADAPPTGEEE